MFLVVRSWMGKAHFAKEDTDPREKMSYKMEKQTIIDIVRLTDLGASLSLEKLRQMYIDNLFAQPSEYKQPEQPKIAPPPKPPKEMLGPKE